MKSMIQRNRNEGKLNFIYKMKHIVRMNPQIENSTEIQNDLTKMKKNKKYNRNQIQIIKQ